jgi:hypothetical protein
VRHAIVPIIALCLLTASCSAAGFVSSGSGPSPSSASSAQASPAQVSSTSPPASVPVLGESRGATEGYGSARPTTISNGGDPTGIVMDVSWQSWGGPEAMGTGTGYYDPPNVPVAESKAEQATVVAFDLGSCGGTYMYQGIEWYFPESGGSFDNTTYLNICSWTYYPGPAATG